MNLKNTVLSGMQKMVPGVSKVINNVKETIQTNVNNIVNNISGMKPTLGKIKLGNRELEEVKLISQGGYAYVFEVKDTNTGETFALKKMICQSTERLRTAKNEISVLKTLPDHPNILKLYDSDIVKVSDGHHVYILLEYCDGGSIFDLMMKYESTKLNEKQIIFVMREACEGVKALHSCEPPIVHRDLKIENILVHNKKFKLCDFGSCSSRVVDFAEVSQREYGFYEEEYDKNTTLMYRPPEMCDPYQKYIVNDRVDIWMLGCMLYTMCFYKQPFQESSKLSIVNAAYTFPKDHNYPEKMIDIIRVMLTPNPRNRPSIFEMCDIFRDYFSIESVELNAEAQLIKDESLRKEQEYSNKGPGEDIPIEELLKIQKKVQRTQKKKDKEPEYIEWNKAKYPGQKASPQKAQDDWGDFQSSHFDNHQGEIGSEAFGEFGQFSGGETKQENPAVWGDFDFANSGTTKPQEEDKNDWNGNVWETPQFNAGNENKMQGEFENFGFAEDKGNEPKADANNFDFFGDFSNAGNAENTNTSKKNDIEDNLI